MESQGIVDGCDVLEMDCVGNFEAFHSVSVPPFLEVHLEGTATPIAVVTAYLTLVFDSKSMKFI